MERDIKKVRVAVYTRKSVEDAEDKAFNSIDAQRQMCENFIAAKAAEGWVALPDRYDDYGYSGGDLDRPAYQRLMADCEAGKIDKIIVFRIDRMTRSTKDFCDFDERMKRLGEVTSVSQLAETVGLERHYVIHTLRLATLSPRIIRAALSGELPDGFSLQKVRKVETDDWEEQERQLGFPVEDEMVGSRVPA